MHSAGNDIVALRGTNSERTNNERFYRQIISKGEQLAVGSYLLPEGKDPDARLLSFEQFVWVAWSVKESLFKFLKRLQPGLAFSPVKMEIKDLVPPLAEAVDSSEEIDPVSSNCWSGIVEFSGAHYFFKAYVTQTHIASIVNDGPLFENMYWGVRETNHPDAALSRLVREFVSERLVTLFPGANITISEPNNSFPVISIDGVKQENIFLSFSHHSGFLSYMFKMIPAGQR